MSKNGPGPVTLAALRDSVSLGCVPKSRQGRGVPVRPPFVQVARDLVPEQPLRAGL